jgi:WD repeat and SOF domain-containing protein 1
MENKKLYSDAVKKRFSKMPEIQRMNHQDFVPKYIKTARQLKHVQKTSENKKIDNRKRHSKPGDIEILPEKKRVVIKEFN